MSPGTVQLSALGLYPVHEVQGDEQARDDAQGQAPQAGSARVIARLAACTILLRSSPEVQVPQQLHLLLIQACLPQLLGSLVPQSHSLDVGC